MTNLRYTPTRANSKIRTPCTNCVIWAGQAFSWCQDFTGANCATNAAEGLLHIYGELRARPPAAAQAVAPPRPDQSARACRCRRRRRHHRRVSPRRHASLHLTALELRTETADGTLWQTEQRPPRRSLLRPAEAACGGHFPSVFRRAPAAPLLLAVASQCVGLIQGLRFGAGTLLEHLF